MKNCRAKSSPIYEIQDEKGRRAHPTPLQRRPWIFSENSRQINPRKMKAFTHLSAIIPLSIFRSATEFTETPPLSSDQSTDRRQTLKRQLTRTPLVLSVSEIRFCRRQSCPECFRSQNGSSGSRRAKTRELLPTQIPRKQLDVAPEWKMKTATSKRTIHVFFCLWFVSVSFVNFSMKINSEKGNLPCAHLFRLYNNMCQRKMW